MTTIVSHVTCPSLIVHRELRGIVSEALHDDIVASDLVQTMHSDLVQTMHLV